MRKIEATLMFLGRTEGFDWLKAENAQLFSETPAPNVNLTNHPEGSR